MLCLRRINFVALVKLANKSSKAFELLHMDLFGPTQYTSIGGNKYGFVIVDTHGYSF